MRFALSKLETIRWRPFVTLVCLIAFLVVGVGHAGSHIDTMHGKSSVEFSAGTANGDAGDHTQASAEVCIVCVLAMADIASMPVIAGEIVRESRSPGLPAFHVVSLPAENPPPIA